MLSSRKWACENVSRGDSILDGEVNANAPDGTHRVRGVTNR
jgi:hypothetical protein